MESIKKYSVKIDYSNSQGSGVLVKVDNKHCYLITAKHNFKQENDDNHLDVITSSLNLDEIKITDPNENEICKVEKVVYKKSNLDLLIFSIKQNSNYIKNLPIVEIIKDRHTINKKHFFYGFPLGEEQPSGELTALTFKVKEDERYILSLRADKGIDLDYEKGFSGSGVFVKDGNSEDGYTYYLTGIVIKAHDGQSLFETISLSEIIDDINHKIYPKINIQEAIFDVDFSKNIYTRILKRRKATYLVQKFLECFPESEHKLSDLKENLNSRNDIISFLDNDDQELRKREKELADLYLLKAITYHADNKLSKANTCFNKAKNFNSQFKKYKLDNSAELNTSDSQLEGDFTILEKAKISYIDEEYMNAIELFNKAVEAVSDKNDKLDIYQYLANSYKKIDKNEKAIDAYINALEHFEKDSLGQSEIYYELALLTEEKEALDYIDIGLGILKKDTNNEYLELKYKLDIYKKKLLNLEDGKILNPTLIKLFQKNPLKYMDEFLENLKSSNGEISTNDIYQKIQDMHLDIKDIQFYAKKNQPLKEKSH